MRNRGRMLLLLSALSLLACAHRPPPSTGLRATTPAMAVELPAESRGKTVEWGGVLTAAAYNRRDSTRLEILAYPLDAAGRPDRGGSPLGRFVALREGYLEALEFAPGRLVTVSGPITGIRRGRIGQANYTYPIVDARQLWLWPREAAGSDSRIHFGIGVGVGF